MICRKLIIEINNDEVQSIFPQTDHKNKGSVSFNTEDGHSVTLDESTLRRGLACLEAHREIISNRARSR